MRARTEALSRELGDLERPADKPKTAEDGAGGGSTPDGEPPAGGGSQAAAKAAAAMGEAEQQLDANASDSAREDMAEAEQRLMLAASVLADLRPRRRSVVPSIHPTS